MPANSAVPAAVWVTETEGSAGEILVAESSSPDGSKSWLTILDAANGDVLRTFPGAIGTYAGPSIAHGLIFWTDAYGHATALGVPANIPVEVAEADGLAVQHRDAEEEQRADAHGGIPPRPGPSEGRRIGGIDHRRERRERRARGRLAVGPERQSNEWHARAPLDAVNSRNACDGSA